MKKRTTTILSLLLLALTANTQITLEHTFTTKGGRVSLAGSQVYAYNFSTGDVRYSHFDTETGKVTLYKDDYSVYKTVTIPSTPDFIFNSISYVSDKLFDTDDAIEFLITFYKYDNELKRTNYSYKVYNENGAMIKDFGEALGFDFFIVNGKYKLLKSSRYPDANDNYITEVYSLPGVPLDNISVSKAGVMEMQYAYPNPSNTTITLPYSLAPGQSSVMSIYDAGGQLIDTKLIDSNFDKIQLNVNSYRSGIYLYEYNGVSSRFMIE